MKLLLDQGLPRSAARLLTSAGWDTIHVGDIGYEVATDEAILERARGEGRIVVTLDADFHALLALSSATAPSVIRIRIEGLRGKEVAALVGRCIGTDANRFGSRCASHGTSRPYSHPTVATTATFCGHIEDGMKMRRTDSL